MAVQMQSIQVYSRAVPAPIRAIPETVGTTCHNCPMFNCIPTGKRRQPWRFYCDSLRRSIKPIRGECPAPQARRRESFGAWLARRVKEEGITYAALADAVGVDRGTVWSWKQGRFEPSAPTRRRVEERLGPWRDGPGCFNGGGRL